MTRLNVCVLSILAATGTCLGQVHTSDAGVDEAFSYHGRMNWSPQVVSTPNFDFEVRVMGDEVAYDAFWVGNVDGVGGDEFAFTVYQRVACHITCHHEPGCDEDGCVQADTAAEIGVFPYQPSPDPDGLTGGYSYSPYYDDEGVAWVEVWGWDDNHPDDFHQIGDVLWGHHSMALMSHSIMGLEDVDNDGCDEMVIGTVLSGDESTTHVGSVSIWAFSKWYHKDAPLSTPRWVEVFRFMPDTVANPTHDTQMRFGYRVETRANIAGKPNGNQYAAKDILIGAKSWREDGASRLGAVFGFVMPDYDDWTAAERTKFREEYRWAHEDHDADHTIPVILNPWDHYNFKIYSTDTDSSDGTAGGLGHWMRYSKDMDDDNYDEIIAVNPWARTAEDPGNTEYDFRGAVYLYLSDNEWRKGTDDTGATDDARDLLPEMDSALTWNSTNDAFDSLSTIDLSDLNYVEWVTPDNDEIDDNGTTVAGTNTDDWPDIIFLGKDDHPNQDGHMLGKCSMGTDYDGDGEIDLFVSAVNGKGFYYEVGKYISSAKPGATHWSLTQPFIRAVHNGTNVDPEAVATPNDTGRWVRSAGNLDGEDGDEFIMPTDGDYGTKNHLGEWVSGDKGDLTICRVKDNDPARDEFVDYWRIRDELYDPDGDQKLDPGGTADDMTGLNNNALPGDPAMRYSTKLGRAWTAGDVNNDGIPDIVVGSREYPYRYGEAGDKITAIYDSDEDEDYEPLFDDRLTYYVGHGNEGTTYLDQSGDHPFQTGIVRAGKVYLFFGPDRTSPSTLPGDFNKDGTIDANDLATFMDMYQTGDDAADLNEDGTVDVLDVIELKINARR